MTSRPSKPDCATLDGGGLQHGRYQLRRVIGEGGMAVVHEAIDLSNGRKVALKRLRTIASERQAKLTALFEREYLVLCELKHPRIVEAYEYHVDTDGPYYTMELLEGGDVHRAAPVDYQSACALAYDVCSALSLVHSRRMVYRDLSPSNVRRTIAGVAKLIDFGALAPMGPNGAIVGTLPCVAPEAVRNAPLDARTDLFALGATLYFALVRRHAYPGRCIQELVDTWQMRLAKPSELVPGIPATLDQLVSDLLQLDPEHRPASAAEVMERLAAIGDFKPDESVLVKRAYLTTPALVGRGGTLDVVRMYAERAKNGVGSSVSLRGPLGIGRSRMLEASSIEAMRVGMLVLRADARDAQQGDYGVVRALASSLWKQAPKLAQKLAAPHWAALSGVIGELGSEGAATVLSGSELHERHREVQTALRKWFCDVAMQSPLAILVDDLDRCDPPSAAFVGLLAREVPRHRLLLVSSQTSGFDAHEVIQGALDLCARLSEVVRLEPLGLDLTERLLGSLFGEVPNLSMLAHHVQRLTKGSPRGVLKIAEQLVEDGVVQYGSGAWSIPEELSARDLPSTMAEALARRIRRLGADARRLCYALSCAPSWSFSFDECALLLGSTCAEPLHALTTKCLNELVASEFIEHTSGSYLVSQSVLGGSLGQALAPELRSAAHESFAAVCERRGDMFRCAQHLLRAGQEKRGLDVLVAFMIASVERTDADPRAYHETLKTLPADWAETFDLGLALCAKLARPPRERRAILARLSGLGAQAGARLNISTQMRALLEDVAHDAGLDIFAQLPAEGDAMARMNTALGRAAARYQATEESLRVSDPRTALRELATQTTAVIGVIAYSYSYEDWKCIPSLAPLCPLSPALEAVQTLVQGMGLRVAGRFEEALVVYDKLLARLALPDRAQLPPVHHMHMQARVLGTVAALEAAMGKASAIAHVNRMANEPRFESIALLVEQLHHLFQGNLQAAKQAKQKLEPLRLETNAHHATEAQHMFLELMAYALAQDMTGTKRALDAISPYAELHPSYRAAIHYGSGAYQRMRGDSVSALREIEQALTSMRAGEHLLWASTAAAHVRTLLELGRVDAACQRGFGYLAQGAYSGYMRNQIRAALGLALARSGQLDAATNLLDEAIVELNTLGSTGLNLAVVLEVRAHLATAAGDRRAFEHYAALYAAQWPTGRRLIGADERAADASGVEPFGLDEDDGVSELHSTWSSCHTLTERLRAALELVGRRAGVESATLFVRTRHGLMRTAAWGDDAGGGGGGADVDAWAVDYFAREITQYVTECLDAPEPEGRMGASGSLPDCTAILLGHSDARGHALNGLLVLRGRKPSGVDIPSGIASELSRCLSQLEQVEPEYL